MSDNLLDQKFDIILDDVEWLKHNDPVFKIHFSKDDDLGQSRGHADMAALIRIVVGQQISNKVATTLWQKFITLFDPNDPQSILSAGDDQLKSCGLSRQKITYVRGVAQAALESRLDISGWVNAPDAEVLNKITALKGFGPWSAQMFMMFHLCHRHIWPAADLGIQIGLQKYFGLDHRPDEKQAKSMQDHFNGRETAAAFLLWAMKNSYKDYI